jgi:hypothetical protein
MTLSDWKLPEHLNVYQIALLSAGFDPADYKQYSPDWPDDVARAAAIYLTATQIAADTGKIEFIRERDENYGGETNTPLV